MIFVVATLALAITNATFPDRSYIELPGHEFRKRNLTLKELESKWSDDKTRPYRRAIKKFPDASTCSIPKSDQPNWDAMRTMQEVEVCMFRIHNRIDSIEESKRWFKREGFSVVSNTFTLGQPPRENTTVFATWDVKSDSKTITAKAPFSGPHFWVGHLMANSGVLISLTFDHTKNVMNTSTSFSYK